MTKRYFKRNWDENRGDKYNNWGTSLWYFETDEKGWTNRQIEIYENGNRLKYDPEYLEDEYGGLSDQAFDLEDMAPYIITKEEFEIEWEIEI